MNASDDWRSLLCSYKFNSNNKLSADTGGRLRHQNAHRQLLCHTRTPSTSTAHDATSPASHPPQPPPPTPSMQRYTILRRQDKSLYDTITYARRHRREFCVTGGYTQNVCGTSISNTNRGSAGDSRTKLQLDCPSG